MNTVAVDAEGTTFEDLLPFIRQEAWKFSQKFLTDTEELESHANWIFHRAWITYNPRNGKFKTWLRFLLHKIWIEHVRRAAQRQARLPRTTIDLGRMTAEVKMDAEDWMSNLFSELSDDARFLVSLTLETASVNDLKRLLSNRGNPKPFLERVKDCLRGKKWEGSRITKAVREVRQAL